ncbi:hypothetical protein [Streptomyces chartreusis]|uniref:hypothetical protein n=1 Tax=Streptomyces chartreusis TaxID=1969 RepID=UPI003822BE0C
MKRLLGALSMTAVVISGLTLSGSTTAHAAIACSSLKWGAEGVLEEGYGEYLPRADHFHEAAYRSWRSGTHVGCLDGPVGTDFDLYLEKYISGEWETVARSETASSHEEINYINGTPGWYRWKVIAYSGSGRYRMGMTHPS